MLLPLLRYVVREDEVVGRELLPPPLLLRALREAVPLDECRGVGGAKPDTPNCAIRIARALCGGGGADAPRRPPKPPPKRLSVIAEDADVATPKSSPLGMSWPRMKGAKKPSADRIASLVAALSPTPG